MHFTQIHLPLPTVAYIKECLDYDPQSGVMLWRSRPIDHFRNAHGMHTFNAKHAGRPSGGKMSNGYMSIPLSGKKYLAHRVAWKLMYGEDPKGFIDHKDGDKSHNAINNLREATKQQNAFNVRLNPRNKTGFKGVSWDASRNKFFACIRDQNKTISLGRFDTEELAGAAYAYASQQVQGEFSLSHRSI